jgi:hypothetical protein
MDMSVVTQMTAMLAARTQGLAQVKMLKVQHDMQMDMIARLTEAVKAAPPPGSGTRVDKTA